MSESATATVIEGEDPLELDLSEPPTSREWTVFEGTLGFECASGDWIEREWTGVPVLDLLEAAAVPGDTTHIQVEGANDERACIPLADLTDAIIAVDEGDGFPRFVSPHVLGPRTIKSVTRVRPLVLDPGEDREAYECLPIDED